MRELATVFLHQKTFVGTHGLEIDDYMRVVIAAQACLPILNLGLDYYRGWYTVILYPGAFVAHRELHDESGVVHTGYEELDGESAEGGPVALSWDEARPLAPTTGRRRLQRRDPRIRAQTRRTDRRAERLAAAASGYERRAWSAAMSAAFDTFNDRLDRGEEPPFDDYAGTDPAEFFAVLSELFFTAPDVLHDSYPDAYAQLSAFYRQDPAAGSPG